MLSEKTDLRLDESEPSFALAIAVLRERIRKMSREDQQDLYELLPDVVAGEGEDRESALIAVREILDQNPAKIQAMDLPDESGDELKNWAEFVGPRIREAREAAGMTQEELANAADLPQPHISRLENGKHSPTSMTLEKIAKALGVSATTFDPSSLPPRPLS